MTLRVIKFKEFGKSIGTAIIVLSCCGCTIPAVNSSDVNIFTPESASGRQPCDVSASTHAYQEWNDLPAKASYSSIVPEPSIAAEDMRASSTSDEEGEMQKQEGMISFSEDSSTALNRALLLCELSRIEWKEGELEMAIERLDQAYALILKVDPENNPGLLQEKDNLRVAISRRMLELYSSRLAVENRENRNEIPITINRHVQNEIDAFTIGRERDFFLSAYQRSGRYREGIENALQEAGCPTELAWLPLVESGFKTTAFSPARALGLWQFIPSTGYRYNLNRDRYIDERMNPEKATRAAIEYLQELHAIFGDWTTVLAAYNCGENRVLRTIQKQHINYLDNFWDLYEQLPRETARYVPRFLATLHIIKHPQKYGLSKIVVDPPLEFERVSMDKQTSLKSIAYATGIDHNLLKELNAELRRGILPVDGYELRVPRGMGNRVAEHASHFRAISTRSEKFSKTHVIRRGETLTSIGKCYGVSVNRLMLANGIHAPARLQVGAVLHIPGHTASKRYDSPARRTSRTPGTIAYVVRPGDSLFKIANRFATTTEKIQRMNRMSTTRLSVGQVLLIQQAVVSTGDV